MVHAPLLDVELIREAGLEQQLGGKIQGVKIESSRSQRHSITGVAAVQLEGGKEYKMFFKKFIPLLQKDKEYLNKLHTRFWREASFLPAIHEGADSPLVPRLLGRHSISRKPPYFLFLELLEGPSAYDRYLAFEQEQKEAETEEERAGVGKQKLSHLQQDLKHIARFNGYCNSHHPSFSPNLVAIVDEAHKYHYEELSNGLEHYLKRAVHFWNLGGEEYFLARKRKQYKYNGRKTLRWLQQKKELDLRERLEPIVELHQFVQPNLELQHGDCRLQHNFNGVFCDLEDFGRYPWYRDVVTYTSEEIVAPPVSELPALLAFYLVHKRAYSSSEPTSSLRQLEELEIGQNRENLQRLIREEVGLPTFADFVVGYFTGMMEEDITINGARKKPSKEYLERLLPSYPNHPSDKLQISRMKHIEELYTFITSPEAMYVFQYCTDQQAVVSYFYNLGKLLNDLEFTEITWLGRLETMSRTVGKSTQYAFFFVNPLADGRKSA